MDNDFLDEFFGNDFLGFGKPQLDFYNAAGTKDVKPAVWYKAKVNDNAKYDEYVAICRSVGVDAQDIKVTIPDSDNYIKISGETKTDYNTYNFSCELPIAKAIMDNIAKIECRSENGLSYITLKVKKADSKRTFDIEIK
jgi:HSP20 family molecular chaperone IbpA